VSSRGEEIASEIFLAASPPCTIATESPESVPNKHEQRKGPTMKKLPLFALTVSVALATVVGRAQAADEAKGKKVEYEVYTSYFEKNTSGLTGEASYVALTDQKAFDKVFGPAATMNKQTFLPKDAFEKKLVVAVIKRGNAVWTYKVDKVTADDDTLYVQYDATSKDGGGAKFASPLIVSVDKGKYTAVVFIENGKKVGTAKIEK
jgi:hypothetical protein